MFGQEAFSWGYVHHDKGPTALLRGGKERSSMHQLHDVYMASKEVVQGGGLKKPGVRVLQNFGMY